MRLRSAVRDSSPAMPGAHCAPPVLVRPDFSTSRHAPDDVATTQPFSSVLSVDEMVPFVAFGRVIVVLPMAA